MGQQLNNSNGRMVRAVDVRYGDELSEPLSMSNEKVQLSVMTVLGAGGQVTVEGTFRLTVDALKPFWKTGTHYDSEGSIVDGHEG